MASKRTLVADAIAAKIAALRTGAGAEYLGSVNRFARAPHEVKDQPSVDVVAGIEIPDHKPGRRVVRRLKVVVVVWQKRRAEQALDDLLEDIREAVEGDMTLGGLVTAVMSGPIETDEGFAAFDGFGPFARTSFDTHWEGEEK